MQTYDFCGEQLPKLGFGCMRLPVNEDKSIDAAQVEAMVRYALDHGVNYFDTAYPYHNGHSELVLGQVLSQYPRESFYLADKYPGHVIDESYDPAATFEEQLKKCHVEYFDFYLLHNVSENSIGTYTDEKWGILEYFKEQKRLGRIKHLGFSSHGSVENLKAFLDYCGDAMEFCQIQLNYLDWTLQDAKEKYDLLTDRGIPVWVMEPVRGGKLASLKEEDAEKLRAHRPHETAAAWAFRFLQRLPNVAVCLSGMSNLAQMMENIATYEGGEPLNDEETDLILSIAEGMKDSVPCTACRYCTKGCPMELDIPMLLSHYNELRFAPGVNVAMRLEKLPEDKKSSACIGCGACTAICPQNIDIPAAMSHMTEIIASLPSWAEISRQRVEAAKRNREQMK